MSVADARKNLENSIVAAITWRDGTGVAEDVDTLIAAVRAETLEPATRGQSVGLASAEDRLLREATSAHESMERRQCLLIYEELSRLRAALAAAETKLASQRAPSGNCNGPGIEWYRGALERAEKLAEGKADVEAKLAAAEAENAELRKLCGRAAAKVLRCSCDSCRELIAKLEAAARRVVK